MTQNDFPSLRLLFSGRLLVGALVFVVSSAGYASQPLPAVGDNQPVKAAASAGVGGSSTPKTSLPAGIEHLWANEGGDKVTRDELRASEDSGSVINSIWDGKKISIFGARNEVVSFNLVLEAPSGEAKNVTVSFAGLTGADGGKITTRPASGDDLFDYRGRNIELFFVRYLEIKGLSIDLAYAAYDERHIPRRCRRHYDKEGWGKGAWEDRPCSNKLYPDIAAPLELHSPFAIPAGTNQSIWGDIYIPKTASAGRYTGAITVSEDGRTVWRIPVQLQVRDFTLPDLPHARTMLDYSSETINSRYLGKRTVKRGSMAYRHSLKIIDRHFQMAHRHKISLIGGDGYTRVEDMRDAWESRLSGELFTPARGYEGIGVGTGNNIYSIGTYGSWPWQDGSRDEMWEASDAWVNWMEAQKFSTPTDYFLYLIDESDDFPRIEKWSQWINSNPGPGRRLKSMATIGIPQSKKTPSLDIPVAPASSGIKELSQSVVNALLKSPDRRLYMYNGGRPASGSFAVEDDGVALRQLAWGQFKKKVDRWFYWQSTHYSNYSCGGWSAQTNVFQQAQTFGCACPEDDAQPDQEKACQEYKGDSLGDTGWNYHNGDGVLFFPGTDRLFPADSYSMDGPLASLRLKHWRRGIQDVDYLSLAAALDPEGTAAIVARIIPRVLWEYGVNDPQDPTWVRTDISWSTDPDVWEAARTQLADIIEKKRADKRLKLPDE